MLLELADAVDSIAAWVPSLAQASDATDHNDESGSDEFVTEVPEHIQRLTTSAMVPS